MSNAFTTFRSKMPSLVCLKHFIQTGNNMFHWFRVRLFLLGVEPPFSQDECDANRLEGVISRMPFFQQEGNPAPLYGLGQCRDKRVEWNQLRAPSRNAEVFLSVQIQSKVGLIFVKQTSPLNKRLKCFNHHEGSFANLPAHSDLQTREI